MSTTPKRERRVRGRRDYENLPARSRGTYGRALDGLARMRSGLSISEAAKRAGTSPSTMRRYLGPALERRGGRVVATKADRLYRRITVLTANGRVDVEVRGSRAAAQIAAHWNAADHYLDTGDTKPLEKFKGKRFGGAELTTKPSEIEQNWTRREMDIDDIYPDR